MDPKGLHDRLLEQMPDGATHNSATCPLCSESLDNGGNPSGSKGGASVNTYTEEDLKAAVDKAVAEATAATTAKVQELEGAAQQSEVEAKVTAVKAEADEFLAAVQKQLDEKVLEAKAAQDELTAIKAWLDDEKAKQDRESDQAARRDERVAKVKEVASFPDDYVTANADRWSAMDDEAFQTYLEDIKVVASKTEGTTVPAKTAMTAARENSGGGDGKVGSVLREVLDLRQAGVDPRRL